MKKIYLFFFFIISFKIQAQTSIDPLLSFDADKQQKWVDSIYAKMTLDQKIGQLFMIQAFSNKKDNDKDINFISTLIEKYHIGGIIFSKGTPYKQAVLTNEFQKKAKVPLFIAMDAEWGLAMRLDSTYAYPWNMTLGAVKNNDLIQQTGKRIAQHCKRLGVHIDFAPDIDINTNPDNPIIGNRSFGEDKENVAQKGVAFTKGMQSVKVLANAKHFPGHGETSQDSHLTLPTISFSKERIEEVELYPFKKLISSGVASFMIGHLSIASLEETGKPSSLSYKIVTELLKEKLGFRGLIFTDALSMKGVSEYAKAGEVDLQAFLAGSDVLLMPSQAIKGIETLKKAYNSKKISEERLAHSVKKILKAKYWAGLHQYSPINLKNIQNEIITKEDELLNKNVYQEAISLAKNQLSLLPFKQLDKQKTGVLTFGWQHTNEFLKNLRLYDDVKHIKSKKWADISKEIKNLDRIIISVHRSNATPWVSYKFSKEEIDLIEKISAEKKVILTLFTSPYALLQFKTLEKIPSVVVAYQNTEVSVNVTAQLLYGALPFKGQLPVSPHKEIPVKTSIPTASLGRLQYGFPESVEMDSQVLAKIDSVVNKSIKEKIMPSAQVLVARKGKVIYNKSFGHFTYENTQKVSDTSLYDLASLTKILSTLPQIMKFYDQNKISENTTLSSLIPSLKNSNKANITLAEALSHYGKLQSWIPFYTQIIPPKNNGKIYVEEKFSQKYPTQIARNMFLVEGFKDSIFQKIKNSDLIKKKRYWYSDLAYYFLHFYIEEQEKTPLNELVSRNFYNKLGAFRLTYLPLNSFPKEQIVPSEEDKIFRKQKIQGFVHDQGAAMLGGVAGHAGLFGNANDVAKMMQLFLQKGYYGGERFFTEKTFDVFNKTHFGKNQNRRGLGFDKPQPRGESGPTCDCVSFESFGHSGFTGTFAWADPKSEIIYVFLSNRTYPDSENKKLITQNIRTKIQKIIQDAIIQ